MKGFFLFIIAVLSFCVFMPFALLFTMVVHRLDWLYYAISLDQSMNALGGTFFTWIWLKDRKKTSFGNMDKTLSFHLGENKINGNLNRFGLLIAAFLNAIDKDHVENAYNNGT